MPADRSAPGNGRTIRPTLSRTTASAWARRASCSPSTRSPTPPETARSGSTHARESPGCASSPGRTPPTPAGVGAPGSVRDRVPERLGRCGVRVLQRYAHDHAKVDLETAKRLLGWVNDQAEADGRGGSAGRSPSATLQLRPASSSAQPGLPGSTCGRRRRPATAPTVTLRVGRASGFGTSRPRGARGTRSRATSRPRFMSGSTAAPQGSDGSSRTSPTPGSTLLRIVRPRGPPWPGFTPARRKTASARSGTRTGPVEDPPSPPSRPGTGAPRESPRSRPASPGGPDEARGDSAPVELPGG